MNSFPSSNHLFIAAETGSGKTIAYGAPLVSSIMKKATGVRSRGNPRLRLVLIWSVFSWLLLGSCSFHGFEFRLSFTYSQD